MAIEGIKTTTDLFQSISDSKKPAKVVSDSFLPAFHFSVSFIGFKTGEKTIKQQDISFSEVSGIGAELQIEEVAEGGENRFVHRLPKPAKYKNLVLKKAMVAIPSPVILWAEQAIYHMQFHPCMVTVSIMNGSEAQLATWKFYHAYPVKFEISGLDAKKSEIVIETLELAYRYSERKKD